MAGDGGGPVQDREHQVDRAVERYADALTRYAARLLGGDTDRARDVVQETFLKLWDADLATLDGHLAEWLYTVTRRRALDVRRKEGRMRTLEESAEATIESGGAEPGAVVEAKDSAAAALRVIARLPEAQQEVVRLKFQHGLSYREIARITGHSESNVGFLLHTALKAIRSQMVR